ncbi:MAG: cohesin domain-containing protein [Desulfococcaceae bacterium]|jgi:hypothetical protein|nr:cohesin domain-containing protein [Desulfococcaceae bacterium]
MRIEIIKILVCGFFFLTLPLNGMAYSESRIFLSSEKSEMSIGETLSVDVNIKDAPLFYGADIRLKFDPEYLELLDGDEKKSGLQISPGQFPDPSKSFFLQNQADSKSGTVSYAMSLLNPAPSAEGTGTLAAIAFRAKKAGETDIRIEKGQLGTREGKTLYPEPGKMKMNITKEPLPPPRQKPFPLMIFIAAGFCGAAILIRYIQCRFPKTPLPQGGAGGW